MQTNNQFAKPTKQLKKEEELIIIDNMVKKKETQKVDIDPWGKALVQDYLRLIKNFGMQKFDIDEMPNPSMQMKRGIIFGGQDLKQIAEAIRKKKKFYCLTGIMPSAEKIHLGTAAVVDNVR